MMTTQTHKWQGFTYQPDEVINKSDRYVFHKNDGEKTTDKIITCDELTCWCQKEFDSLSDVAEDEFLNGHKVVTEKGVFSLDSAESFELEEADS